MTENQIHFYGEIQKFDAAEDGSLMVSGIASSEAVDADGEIITAEAMRKALPSYLQCGTVREMHQPIAAGKPVSAFVDDDGKTHFTAKIVDKGTVAKIQEGILKGFSIGGKALKRAGNKITEILLKDISVVDIPNNPLAFFEIIKFDKPGDKCDDPECKTHTEAGDDKKKSEKEKAMTEEAMKKLDALAATVDELSKTVKTLSESAAPAEKLEKALTEIGELQKRASETQTQVQMAERKAILAKMDSEGRVAMNPETNVAYTVEELEKMDLNVLKFAAKNSPVIPLKARAIYKGDSAPKISPDVKGSARVLSAWGEKYGNLDVMKAQLS